MGAARCHRGPGGGNDRVAVYPVARNHVRRGVDAHRSMGYRLVVAGWVAGAGRLESPGARGSAEPGGEYHRDDAGGRLAIWAGGAAGQCRRYRRLPAARTGGTFPAGRTRRASVRQRTRARARRRSSRGPGRTRTGGGDRRRLRTTVVGGGAAATWWRDRYGRGHRRRGGTGLALQPAGARSRVGEHEPGHLRGRRGATPGSLEPSLCQLVRLSARIAASRASGGRADALQHRSRHDRRGRTRGARAAAADAYARGHTTSVRASFPRWYGGGDSWQPDARWRLRGDVYRCHRVPTG